MSRWITAPRMPESLSTVSCGSTLMRLRRFVPTSPSMQEMPGGSCTHVSQAGAPWGCLALAHALDLIGSDHPGADPRFCGRGVTRLPLLLPRTSSLPVTHGVSGACTT